LEFSQIGRTQKPHGIKGEINIVFQKAEYVDIDTEFYFLEIEGIPVPFFVEEVVFCNSTTARVKFADVEDEKMASRYKNLNVLLPFENVENVQISDVSRWEFYVGFSIIDQKGNNLGVITEVDEATINVLFLVEKGDEKLLIPATEDFITAVDEKNKKVKMNLPEGLLD
jgi:16S rRNA processing protein RimM